MHHSPRLSLELLVSNDKAVPVAPMLCYVATSVSPDAAGVAHNAGVAFNAGSANGTGSTALALGEPWAAGIAGRGTEGWATAAFPSRLQAVPEEHAGAHRTG